MVTPAARREAAAHLGEAYGVSQRRACRTIGAGRASIRYLSRRGDDGAWKIFSLADTRRTEGCKP